MKKVFFCCLFLIISSLCFAETVNVCIYPSNSNISDYLTNTVKTVPYSEELSQKIAQSRSRIQKYELENSLHQAYRSESENSIQEAVKKIEDYRYESDGKDFEIKTFSYIGEMDTDLLDDKNFLSYICRNTNCDVLILNETIELDSLSMRSIRIYSNLDNEITEISTRVSSESDVFTAEELKAIALYFNAEENRTEEKAEVKIEKPLKVTSSVPSVIRLEGVEVGQTPYTFESYKLPMILNFSSEGYSDRYVYITEETEEINAVLKPQWMEDRDIYLKVRDRFYYSLAGALLSVGVQALVNSVIPSDSAVLPYAKGVAGALTVITIGNFIYNVIDYYNFADYNSKR